MRASDSDQWQTIYETASDCDQWQVILETASDCDQWFQDSQWLRQMTGDSKKLVAVTNDSQDSQWQWVWQMASDSKAAKCLSPMTSDVKTVHDCHRLQVIPRQLVTVINDKWCQDSQVTVTNDKWCQDSQMTVTNDKWCQGSQMTVTNDKWFQDS